MAWRTRAIPTTRWWTCSCRSSCAAPQTIRRDLLDHVNKYTGKRYADEPAVGMVEINNEDTLFMWGAEKHLEELAEPYAGVLEKLWNDWLVKKYGSREKLRDAWAVGCAAAGGESAQRRGLRDVGQAGIAVGVGAA